VVSYEVLLDIFWSIHDPTSLNRQGADRGEQYRSVIFFHTPEQEQIGRRSKEKLERSLKYEKTIVTQIQRASTYWLAEEYHQQYFEKKGRHYNR
jgi:peptide-methionine (S)-S-oxide reductase